MSELDKLRAGLKSANVTINDYKGRARRAEAYSKEILARFDEGVKAYQNIDKAYKNSLDEVKRMGSHLSEAKFLINCDSKSILEMKSELENLRSNRKQQQEQVANLFSELRSSESKAKKLSEELHDLKENTIPCWFCFLSGSLAASVIFEPVRTFLEWLL